MSSSASTTLATRDAKTDSDTGSYAQRNAHYWRRNLAICVFGSFTTLVSLTLLLPFLPIYVEQLGVHGNAAIVEWSGIAFGATFLGTGLTAPLWGYLSDRYGRRPMLIRAAVGMALLMPLIGLAHNVWQLVLLRLFRHGAGGNPDAARTGRLGAGHIVDRRAVRRLDRPPDRRLAARADRHTPDFFPRWRRDRSGGTGDDVVCPRRLPARAIDRSARRAGQAGRCAMAGDRADVRHRHAGAVFEYVDRTHHHRLFTRNRRRPQPGGAVRRCGDGRLGLWQPADGGAAG